MFVVVLCILGQLLGITSKSKCRCAFYTPSIVTMHYTPRISKIVMYKVICVALIYLYVLTMSVYVNDDHFFRTCSHSYNRAKLFCTSNTSHTFSKTIPQYVFPLKLPFSLNDSYVIPLFLKPRSVTDPTFVLILKENAPLFKQSEWCLNGVDRHRHRLFNVRLGLLGIFICIAFLRCRNFLEISLTTVFSSPYMTTGKLPTRVRKKVRHYYTLSRCRLVSTLVVILLLLLVLCGDVHPNPGPGVSFLTHGHRHTDAHLLNTASWNVRTLLDTKRAAGRPSAIVAQELDRYNIDIAAISETRVLGDT